MGADRDVARSNIDPDVLVARIINEITSARVDVTAFPSGAFVADVRIEHRVLVIAYQPSSGVFGIDELGSGDRAFDGYRYSATTVDGAINALRVLVSEG